MKVISFRPAKMDPVFRDYIQILNQRRWSTRYWDGGPTHFLSTDDYENLMLKALAASDTAALNILLDEVDPDLMTDVADQVTNYATPELLKWYVTTTYPPLLLTLTPERFLESADLQDAIVSWPSNLYVLIQWYQGMGETGRAALTQLESLFLEGTLNIVATVLPTYTIKGWQALKKARFLNDRERICGTTNDCRSTSSTISTSGKRLPPRQGDRR